MTPATVAGDATARAVPMGTVMPRPARWGGAGERIAVGRRPHRSGVLAEEAVQPPVAKPG